MYPVRVKICGIRSADEAEAALGAGVHALGFIFADSPRKISPGDARDIIKGLPPFVGNVGVFVNEKVERVKEIAEISGLDTLQFHGDESPEYCSRFPDYKVIKALTVGNSVLLNCCVSYDVDALLLDTYYPDKKGGGGRTFNWEAVVSAKEKQWLQRPIILAGGLNPENICKALDTVRPFGIDVSSGVESGGKKSAVRIRQFMSRIHNWNKNNLLEQLSSTGEER